MSLVVRDLAKETGTEEQLMRLVLRQAAQQGIITAIVKRSVAYRNDRIVAFASRDPQAGSERDQHCAADFSRQAEDDVGRKLAIQIADILTGWICDVTLGMIIYYVMRYYFRKRE